MIRLALVLTRAGGWPRMLLLAGCTAVVSALLLVVIALLRLPPQPEEVLFSLVEDPGTRGGTAFASTLLTVPPLLLLYQAVRLGTAARERRLAGLRLAGATPAEVRRLGAFEVGVPALLGSLSGVGLYGVLRVFLGGRSYLEPVGPLGIPPVRLVPTTVAPTLWQVFLVVVGVAALGVVVGLRASRRVVVSPLGVSRRQLPPPPRPWGLVLIAAAAALAPFAASWERDTQLIGIAIVGLAVIGIVTLAPWAAYRVGRYAEARAGSPAMLLAARRLVTEPRPVGRAAAAVGAIAMVSGGAAGIGADLVGSPDLDPFYLVSLALVGLALLAALLVVTGTLAVHSVESLLDRKRSIAALGALGAPAVELERAQRFEAALVAVPMALVGVLLGSSPMLFLVERTVTGAMIMLLNVVMTLALVWVAIFVAVRATRSWALRAGGPGNLRTE